MHITYTLHTSCIHNILTTFRYYICYICYIWIIYGLHMIYIQFTYENWFLQFLHMLLVIYIQFTHENQVAYILHTIDKAFSEIIFVCSYFIAKGRNPPWGTSRLSRSQHARKRRRAGSGLVRLTSPGHSRGKLAEHDWCQGKLEMVTIRDTTGTNLPWWPPWCWQEQSNYVYGGAECACRLQSIPWDPAQKHP